MVVTLNSRPICSVIDSQCMKRKPFTQGSIVVWSMAHRTESRDMRQRFISYPECNGYARTQIPARWRDPAHQSVLIAKMCAGKPFTQGSIVVWSTAQSWDSRDMRQLFISHPECNGYARTINIMATDALAPYVTRTSAAMILANTIPNKMTWPCSPMG